MSPISKVRNLSSDVGSSFHKRVGYLVGVDDIRFWKIIGCFCSAEVWGGGCTAHSFKQNKTS